MRRRPIALAPLVLLILAAPVALLVHGGGAREGGEEEKRPDVVFADFEGKDHGDWDATGKAFGKGPATGALPGQMPVSGFKGKRLVNSYHGGDRATGTLTSPAFEISRKYISFLVGGGGHAGKTCINLVVGGRVV